MFDVPSAFTTSSPALLPKSGLAEILYVDSIPANVSINEAVELGKIYGDERSYAFINSVLGKINRELNEQ